LKFQSDLVPREPQRIAHEWNCNLQNKCFSYTVQ
jgi:hypothetical protein